MLRFGTKKTLRNDFDNDDDLSMEDDVAVKDSMEIKNQDVSKSDESERNPKHKLFWNSQVGLRVFIQINCLTVCLSDLGRW